MCFRKSKHVADVLIKSRKKIATKWHIVQPKTFTQSIFRIIPVLLNCVVTVDLGGTAIVPYKIIDN